MSSGVPVKLLILTAPRTPCAPATAPTHTRLPSALTANSVQRPPSGAAGGSAGSVCGLLSACLRLGFRRRFERSLAHCRLLHNAGIAEKARDAVARQCPYPEPVLDAFFLQGHAVGMPAIEHRVI